MKTILLSDIHLVGDNPVGRLDNLVETQWEKLEYVFKYAYNNKIRHILQAADLTHIRRSWALLQRLTLFLEYWRKKGVILYCIRGQHDSYYHDMTNDKTIIGVLISAGLIIELKESPTVIDQLVNVYGSSYGMEVPVIEKGKKHETNILVIHKQILVNTVFSQQTDYVFADQFLKDHSEFDLILCGDCHQLFQKTVGNRTICNTGVMLRLEASDQMFKHEPSFFVYDIEKNKLQLEKIPCAKAKSVLSREHLQEQKQRKHNFDSFINRVKDTSDDQKSVSFEKNLALIVKKNKTTEPVRKIISNYLEEKDK